MRVTIESLYKSFQTLRGRVHAISDVNMEISDGEFFVLLGPSGCGKSTLLNLLAGLEKPSDGEIRFNDRIISSTRRKIYIPPGKRDVSMVFQSYALYPHMSVEENIAFPLKVAKISKDIIQNRVIRIAGQLDISDLLKRRPAELSGGQRQRVAIGRAIVREPDLFLLDEPLSNLDAQLRNSTRVMIKKLQRELGITTLYVTHDQTEAMTLGDRIALFKGGKIIQIASPSQLYERPINPFAARFVGTFPMNMLEGKLIRNESSYELCYRENSISFDRSDFLSANYCGDPMTTESITKLNDGDVTIGFRPEHARISDPDKGTLNGCVDSLELLGRETLVHIKTSFGELLVLVEGDGRRYRQGENVSVHIDPRRLHIFDI